MALVVVKGQRQQLNSVGTCRPWAVAAALASTLVAVQRISGQGSTHGAGPGLQHSFYVVVQAVRAHGYELLLVPVAAAAASLARSIGPEAKRWQVQPMSM